MLLKCKKTIQVELEQVYLGCDQSEVDSPVDKPDSYIVSLHDVLATDRTGIKLTCTRIAFLLSNPYLPYVRVVIHKKTNGYKPPYLLK